MMILVSSAISAQTNSLTTANNDLFAAVASGNRKAVKNILSSRNARYGVNSLNAQNKTALDVAAERGYFAIARDLMSRGGQVTSEKNAIFLKDNLKNRALKFFVFGWFFTPFLWFGSVASLNKVSNLYVINV